MLKERGQFRGFISPRGESPRPITAQERAKRIERDIHNWQRDFPGRALINLLPAMVARSPTTAKAVIERIERNQGNKLSVENLIFLAKMKQELVGKIPA